MTARLHQALEYYDEYERPQRGFFMAERDPRADPRAAPLLVYVAPASLNAEPAGPARRPPDWIGEVLEGEGAPSRLERYARAGVPEYWRIVVDPALPGGMRFEIHTEVRREAGDYASVVVCPPDAPVASATFPGLVLRPAQLLEG